MIRRLGTYDVDARGFQFYNILKENRKIVLTKLQLHSNEIKLEREYAI